MAPPPSLDIQHNLEKSRQVKAHYPRCPVVTKGESSEKLIHLYKYSDDTSCLSFLYLKLSGAAIIFSIPPILDACFKHAGVTSTNCHRGMVFSRDPEGFLLNADRYFSLTLFFFHDLGVGFRTVFADQVQDAARIHAHMMNIEPVANELIPLCCGNARAGGEMPPEHALRPCNGLPATRIHLLSKDIYNFDRNFPQSGLPGVSQPHLPGEDKMPGLFKWIYASKRPVLMLLSSE